MEHQYIQKVIPQQINEKQSSERRNEGFKVAYLEEVVLKAGKGKRKIRRAAFSKSYFFSNSEDRTASEAEKVEKQSFIRSKKDSSTILKSSIEEQIQTNEKIYNNRASNFNKSPKRVLPVGISNNFGVVNRTSKEINSQIEQKLQGEQNLLNPQIEQRSSSLGKEILQNQNFPTKYENVFPQIKSKQSKDNSISFFKRFNSVENSYAERSSKATSVRIFQKNSKKNSQHRIQPTPKYSLVEKVQKNSLRGSKFSKKIEDKPQNQIKKIFKTKYQKNKQQKIKLMPIEKPVGYSENIPDPDELLQYFKEQKFEQMLKQNDEHDIFNFNFDIECKNKQFRMLSRISEQSMLSQQQYRIRLQEQIFKEDLKQIYQFQNTLIQKYYQAERQQQLQQLPLAFSSKLQQQFVHKHKKSISTLDQPTYLRKTFLGQLQLEESNFRIKRALLKIRKYYPALFRKLLNRPQKS